MTASKTKDAQEQAARETPTRSSVVPQAQPTKTPQQDAQTANTDALLDLHLAGPNAVRAFNHQRAQGLLPPALHGASMRRAYLRGAHLNNLRARGADLRAADLREADLRHADLENANLESADLRHANLTQANLSGAQLHGAQLSGASLHRADLRKVEGLQIHQLSATNLSHVKLPRGLNPLAAVAITDEWSRNNRTLFLAVLLSCLYCLLTIAGTKDAALKLDMQSSELPFLDLQIPLRQFYWVAPYVLLIVFAYLQVNLQRLWEQISRLPTAFPDGRRVDEVLEPWLLAQIARVRQWQWRNGEAPLMWAQALASGAMSWALLPLVLVSLWWRGLVVDDPGLSMAQGLACMASLCIAYWSYRNAMLTLSHGELRLPGLRRLRRTPLWVACVSMAWIAIAYAAGGALSSFRRQRIAVSLYGAELPGRHLSGADAVLNGARLPSSNFESATLIEAELRGVNLMNSNLRHTRLAHADMERAKLMNADMTRAVLEHANLRQADMREALLRAADCNNADLSQAQLAKADLSGVKLNGGKLLDADLWGAVLDGAYLVDANLAQAALIRAELRETSLLGASLQDAHLDGALLDDADLSHTNLIRAVFRAASGQRVSFINAWLIDADLDEANLPEVQLDGAQLDYARMRQAILDTGSMHDTLLTRADLSYASLVRVDLTGAKMSQASLRFADLDGADLTDAHFDDTDVSGAKLQTVRGLTAAQLQGMCGMGTVLVQVEDQVRAVALQACGAAGERPATQDAGERPGTQGEHP